MNSRPLPACPSLLYVNGGGDFVADVQAISATGGNGVELDSSSRQPGCQR